MATNTEILDLRTDLGDTAGAFSEAELERLLERSQDKDGFPQHWVAVAMGIFQLLTQAARFADYVVNEAQERRSEIWANLKGTYELLLLRPDVAAALGSQSGGGGGLVTRNMKYTRTRGTGADEFAIPDFAL